MKNNLNTLFYLVLFFVLTGAKLHAQETTFSCQNTAYHFLEGIIGEWEVQTKDRISPGIYEDNKGHSKISNLIEGCGVQESFRGKYRNKDYARETMMMGKDSTGIQMSILDSEHSSFSILNGTIEEGILIVYWYRDNKVKKLQSKYILTIEHPDKFEFSSFLSGDHGESWALTHQRIYTRTGRAPSPSH